MESLIQLVADSLYRPPLRGPFPPFIQFWHLQVPTTPSGVPQWSRTRARAARNHVLYAGESGLIFFSNKEALRRLSLCWLFILSYFVLHCLVVILLQTPLYEVYPGTNWLQVDRSAWYAWIVDIATRQWRTKYESMKSRHRDNMVVEQNESNIVIVSVRISHMWQCHVSQMTDTERNNGVGEERTSLVIHVTKSCHLGDSVNLRDNVVMRKEPVMTESKGQWCLLERTCHVTITGEIHEIKGPQPTRCLHLSGTM